VDGASKLIDSYHARLLKADKGTHGGIHKTWTQNEHDSSPGKNNDAGNSERQTFHVCSPRIPVASVSAIPLDSSLVIPA
jgi:hypothetical protein